MVFYLQARNGTATVGAPVNENSSKAAAASKPKALPQGSSDSQRPPSQFPPQSPFFDRYSDKMLFIIRRSTRPIETNVSRRVSPSPSPSFSFSLSFSLFSSSSPPPSSTPPRRSSPRVRGGGAGGPGLFLRWRSSAARPIEALTLHPFSYFFPPFSLLVAVGERESAFVFFFPQSTPLNFFCFSLLLSPLSLSFSS